MWEDIRKKLVTSEGYAIIGKIKTFQKESTEEELKWFNDAPGVTLSEKMYLCEQGLTSPPICSCGKPLQFISWREGYRQYCSKSCRATSPEALQKRKETTLQRYGVEHASQSKDIQKKMRDTTEKRYGVSNVFQDVEKMKQARREKLGVDFALQSSEIKRKWEQTNIEKYGASNPNQNIDVINKRKETNLARYGNACSLGAEEIRAKRDKTWIQAHGGHPSKNPAVMQKIIESRHKHTLMRLLETDRLKDRVTPLFTEFSGVTLPHKYKCNICSLEFEDILKNSHVPRCPACYPSQRKQGEYEIEIVDWLKKLLPYSTPIIQNTRSVISPVELDIYLPTHSLAIELDEVYWHSEAATNTKRGKRYHINKTEACEKQEIQLLHILDIEWIYKQQIVKSIIAAKLGIFETKIGARSCSIQEVSTSVSNEFLNRNHIQGQAGAQIKLGLFYRNTLVSLLLIGRNRFKDKGIEIVRFANQLNTSVVGGFSKLWKHAQQLTDCQVAISYTDLRYFSGRVNSNGGFTLSHRSPPSYYYTKNYAILENRLKYQKHKLSEIFGESNVDLSLTEWEIMQLNGYDRIWDCGTDVWMWNKADSAVY